MEEKAIYIHVLPHQLHNYSLLFIIFLSKDVNFEFDASKAFQAKNTCLEHCTDWQLNWWQVIPINRPWKAQSFALCETGLYKKKGTWVFLVDDKLSFTVHFENLVKKLKVSIKPKQTTALVHIHFTKQC